MRTLGPCCCGGDEERLRLRAAALIAAVGLRRRRCHLGRHLSLGCARTKKRESRRWCWMQACCSAGAIKVWTSSAPFSVPRSLARVCVACLRCVRAWAVVAVEWAACASIWQAPCQWIDERLGCDGGSAVHQSSRRSIEGAGAAQERQGGGAAPHCLREGACGGEAFAQKSSARTHS